MTRVLFLMGLWIVSCARPPLHKTAPAPSVSADSRGAPAPDGSSSANANFVSMDTELVPRVFDLDGMTSVKVANVEEDVIAIDCSFGRAREEGTITRLRPGSVTSGALAGASWKETQHHALPPLAMRVRDPWGWIEPWTGPSKESAVRLALCSTETGSHDLGLDLKPTRKVRTIAANGGGGDPEQWAPLCGLIPGTDGTLSIEMPSTTPKTRMPTQGEIRTVDAVSVSVAFDRSSRPFVSTTWRAERTFTRRKTGEVVPEVHWTNFHPGKGWQSVQWPDLPSSPGSAIAIGDIDGDGLPEFAFSGNAPPLLSRRAAPAVDKGRDTLTLASLKASPENSQKTWRTVLTQATDGPIRAIGICHVDDATRVPNFRAGLVLAAGSELRWIH